MTAGGVPGRRFIESDTRFLAPDTRLSGFDSGFVRPGQTLGVLGGGQLGRMFVQAAQQRGYRTVVLDPDPASPAGAVAHEHIRSDYLDAAGLDRLAAQCVAITTEFENVPAQALEVLATRCLVAPAAASVAVCQDRAAEKAAFARFHVDCAPFLAISASAKVAAGTATATAIATATATATTTSTAASTATSTEASTATSTAASTATSTAASTATSTEAAATLDVAADAASALYPAILKTARLGYDGKGQRAVADRADLAAAYAAFGEVACVLEKRLPLAAEVSVVVARGRGGEIVHLPVQENAHRDGILAVTRVPARRVSAAQQAEAVAMATRLATSLGYVGVLCVEFFVLADGSLVANEMAPRPHNSGHYSIDACDLSQFDLQVRTLTGAPLVMPRLHSPCVMLNLLGDLWFGPDDGTAVEPGWPSVLALPGVHLHLYGKAEPRRGRKMGHLTVTAASAEAADTTAAEVARRLGLPLD